MPGSVWKEIGHEPDSAPGSSPHRNRHTHPTDIDHNELQPVHPRPQ